MLLFMVANKNEAHSRYKSTKIETLLKAQIENSLELGWSVGDIIIYSNFDFEFMGVKTEIVELNDFCFTGSKMFGLKHLFNSREIDDVVWAHDLDAWQNCPFRCPDFGGDVGCAQYSTPKYNGGSIFWTPKSKDIIDEVVKRLTEDEETKEEPTLNRVFKSGEYKERISIVDHTYNVGCSGYVPRFERSIKPIRVCHFHPYNGTAWEIHALDRDDAGAISVSPRLESLLRRYYPLATELKKSVRKRNELRRQEQKPS